MNIQAKLIFRKDRGAGGKIFINFAESLCADLGKLGDRSNFVIVIIIIHNIIVMMMMMMVILVDNDADDDAEDDEDDDDDD